MPNSTKLSPPWTQPLCWHAAASLPHAVITLLTMCQHSESQAMPNTMLVAPGMPSQATNSGNRHCQSIRSEPQCAQLCTRATLLPCGNDSSVRGAPQAGKHVTVHSWAQENVGPAKQPVMRSSQHRHDDTCPTLCTQPTMDYWKPCTPTTVQRDMARMHRHLADAAHTPTGLL
jgi:hypothetical protein